MFELIEPEFRKSIEERREKLKESLKIAKKIKKNSKNKLMIDLILLAKRLKIKKNNKKLKTQQ
jgi:hypothetical protein